MCYLGSMGLHLARSSAKSVPTESPLHLVSFPRHYREVPGFSSLEGITPQARDRLPLSAVFFRLRNRTSIEIGSSASSEGDVGGISGVDRRMLVFEGRGSRSRNFNTVLKARKCSTLHFESSPHPPFFSIASSSIFNVARVTIAGGSMSPTWVE